MCGEKLIVKSFLTSQEGSPPRVRGKAVKCPCDTSTSGITPACAGKSVRYPFGRLANQDHPRVCGEKGPRSYRMSVCVGSPPRVRGKGIEEQERGKDYGITPACAGKSFGGVAFAAAL